MSLEKTNAERSGDYEQWIERARKVSSLFFKEGRSKDKLDSLVSRHEKIFPKISNYSRLYHSIAGSGVVESKQLQASPTEMADFEEELKDLIEKAEESNQVK